MAAWTKVETQKEIEHLLDVFGGFHDGCLREVHIWTEHYVSNELSMACPAHLDTHIRVLFQRQFENPSAIELLFDQVIRFNLAPSPENYVSIIFDATLLLQGDTFCWAECSNWTPEFSERDEVTWISAKKLSWRDASEWMGETLRYGPGDK